MKTRIISALVAIPIFAWIILFSPDFIFLGFWFITLALAGYEFSKLIPFAKKNNFYIFNLINCLFLILGLVNFLNLSHYLFSLAFFLWLILVPILLFRYSKFQTINKLEYQIIVFFWLVLSWAVANTLSSFILGKGAILGLLSCIWAADGGAYFTGKFLGKNKFSPKISPN